MEIYLHCEIQKNVAIAIKEAQASCFAPIDMEVSDIYKAFTDPPNNKLGHLAYPCFMLAKSLKKSPAMIAGLLAEKVLENEVIESVTAAGPYLNIYIKKEFIGDRVVKKILNGSYFKIPIVADPPKTMVEYSQPNTHKVLHVGHMRNLCLGNALCKIMNYCGYQVVTATYPGDVGTHVAKCLWYIQNHYRGERPKTDQGEWLGEVYTYATQKLEEEKGTEKEETNRAQLTEVLKQIHKKSGSYFSLWEETRQWSLDLMKAIYDWSGVTFDQWFYESEIDGYSLDLARKYLEQGKLVEDQGAIGIDLREDNLGFCILVKSDGNGNYACKDVALAQIKFDNFSIEKNIYVVDERQSYHFNQVFKVLEKVGFSQAKDCFHLKYEMVELPDGAMSSRKGNTVAVLKLIMAMEKKIIDDYLSKYEGVWTCEEIDQTAKMVAHGAIKYGMLRMDPARKIVFDLAEWLKLDGETGPYLQYVHARIISLMTKINTPLENTVRWSCLTHPTETVLLLKLMKFNLIVEKACRDYNPSKLTAYLYELGRAFNSFYAECSVANAPQDDLKQARLHLVSAVAKVMEQGMELLGIPAPLKM
jgi:arginyl-tRNA synthetase